MSRISFIVTLLLAAGLILISSGYQGAAAQENGARVQVVHLAPFAEDASVTITLNDEPALTDFAYGDSTEYIELPAGTYDVAVIPTGATDPAIEATVILEGNTYYTVIAVGDGVNQNLDLILLEDDLTEPAAGMFHLRLGHLAPFAAGAATADIRHQDGTPILEDVDFGDVTGFIPLDAGEYDLIITTPGGEDTLIDPDPVNFAEGTIVSAFASGDGMNQELDVFALPAGVEGFFLGPTWLQVVHLAPFAEDASVTITLNGAPALTDFAYSDSTEYIELPAGTYDVAVIPTGATDPAIEATVTLASNTYYTVIAVGDGVNQDLDLILLEDDLSEPAEGMFHLRLGHLAPFAAGAATADIRLQDGTPVLLNVDFGDVTGFMPLPAGEYDLKITTPGGDVTLIDPFPVNFAEGTIISAFAVGEGDNQSLGVFALPAGEEGFMLPLYNRLYLPLMLKGSFPANQAGLRVVHASPDAPAVDVWLDGSLAISNLAFGEASDYANLPAGEYDVVVVPAGEEEPRVIEATLTLSPGQNYTVAAIGLLEDIQALVLMDNITVPAAGTAHVRFVHLSPDAPAVDVAVTGGDVLFGNVAFSGFTDYSPVPASTYNLEVRLAGTDTVALPLPGVNLEEGTVYTVFAMGLAAGDPDLQAVIVVDLEPLGN
jgi:hypothetical protein